MCAQDGGLMLGLFVLKVFLWRLNYFTSERSRLTSDTNDNITFTQPVSGESLGKVYDDLWFGVYHFQILYDTLNQRYFKDL